MAATPVDSPPGYPAEWETHAVLADGKVVEVRPIKPTDAPRLDAFHQRQSPTSIYYRFFQHRPKLTPAELERFTVLDYRERMAFVALEEDQLVAVARYEKMPDGGDPEVAFLVDDEHHGRGLATLMLEYLAAAARSVGREGFRATVLPENHGMLRVFRQVGFGVKTRFDDGLIEVELDIRVTPEASEAIADREASSLNRAMERLLRPTSVAVVGASRHPGTVGHELFRSLFDGGFTGEIYGVNPAADQVLGHPVFPSLQAIGAPVELAVVAVPAAVVDDVLDDAIAADVSGLLIVATGFAETGDAGLAHERRLVERARDRGIRIIGPNAFGLVNTAEDTRLRALFLPIEPEPGPVAVVSQTGPLGAAVLDLLARQGIGISSFVAVGNRADVSVNDLLQHWRLDADTKAVVAYVENFGNPRNAANTARALSREKPVVSLRPEDDRLADVLAQSGVILVDSVAELAEVTQLLVDQPPLAGPRIAVVTNASSVARLAIGEVRRAGLEPVVPASVEAPPGGWPLPAVVLGDVESIPLSGAETTADVESALVAAAVDEQVDGVLIALVPNLQLSVDGLKRVIDRVNRAVPKPIVAAGLVGTDQLSVPGVPTFSFPEPAARVLGRVAAYQAWREGAEAYGDDDAVALDDADRERIRSYVDDTLASVESGQSVRRSLWSADAERLGAMLGVPIPTWEAARDVETIGAAAERLGYPVVLKAESVAERAIGEAGGVAIDLHDRAQVEGAYGRMDADPRVYVPPTIVQRMVRAGTNVRIELTQDRRYGASVAVGLGGAAGLRVGTAGRRLLPIGDEDVEALLIDLARTVTIDEASREVLAGMLARLGALAVVAPELATVRLDPVLVAGVDTAVGDLTVEVVRRRTSPWREVRRLG
ncbi:MAG: GNAT family N-acetyltransferase [Actinomycetota bacterium]